MTLNEPVEGLSEAVVQEFPEKVIVAPAALKPGAVWTDEAGEITTAPSPVQITHWDDILTEWGYDPEVYELIQPIKVSTWDVQVADGGTQKLWSYRAGIQLRSAAETIPYDDLVKEIKKHRPRKFDAIPDGDLTFVVCLADWQIGKHDGDGLKGTVDRILNMIDTVEDRIRELRKMGRPLGTLLVAGMGDMVENCDGFYATQTFTVELNRREQLRVTRRLIRDAIARWAKLFKKVIVTAVGGNHGENRKDGKQYTDYSDNDDLTVFEIVAEVFASNPEAYGHVEFRIPKEEIFAVFEVSGVPIGFTHGHHASRGGTLAQQKIKEWWKDQTFGGQAIGNAKILVTGHYHHDSLIQHGDKIHFQCPSEDGGSDWFKNAAGVESSPGTLTFVVGKGLGHGRDWSDLYIA
jgi:predicted phosphodiesterase